MKFYVSEQFLWTEFFYEEATAWGGHLADVLSKVSASDFPRLDFDQSKAGRALSWMKLMGLKMSAVSMDVAEFWECTEQEVRG